MVTQKKFGVWLDAHHAVIVGNENGIEGELLVLAHVNGEETPPNTSEKTENNHKRMLQAKFFKEITKHLQNVTHLHVTGAGQVQEQFIHFLEETPQFKNTVTEESTANKMSNEKLMEFFAGKFQ